MFKYLVLLMITVPSEVESATSRQVIQKVVGACDFGAELDPPLSF